MGQKKIPMERDNKKRNLLEWVKFNRDLPSHNHVPSTGTTGRILESELGFKIAKLKSGPLGGDQQVGAITGHSRTSCLGILPLGKGSSS